MTSNNPYEDYDVIDPWSDDEPDETGNFAFVEDEYDGMGETTGDGLGASVGPVPGNASGKGADALPRTMVRPPLASSPRRPDTQTHARAERLPLRRRLAEHRRERPTDDRGGYRQEAVQAPPKVSAPPRAPRRRRRGGWRRLKRLLRLTFVVACVVGVYWVIAHPIDERLAFSEAEARTLPGNLALSVPTTPSYILALGSDAREGEEFSRTDTMMLIRVDFWASRISLLSIPRDTLVSIEGYGDQKINAAYAFGGPGGAARAVADLTGVKPNHVAVVHFDELKGLVDFLGGVTVNVPTDIFDPDYTGLALDAGMQTLDGETALALARTRYGFELGDFQRQENQRALLTAIMDRMLSLSPTRIGGLVDELGYLIGTDLRCYDLVPLFVRLKLRTPTIYSGQVPATDATIDGVSYVVPDEVALLRVMSAFTQGLDPSAAV